MMNIIKHIAVCLLVSGVLTKSSPGKELVRVGSYENPPKVFVTSDGRTVGVFPELLDNIARQHDWDIEYVYGTWQECLDRLQSGDIDLMMDVAISEERKKLYSFSEEPVLVNWGTAFSREDININSFHDMEGHTVAVMRGSIHTDGKQGIKTLTSQFGIPCRFVEADNYQEVLMLVDSKQADIGIVNRLFGILHADEYDVSPTPIIFNPRVLAFATLKDSERGSRLLKEIDDRLSKEKEDPDSVYHQILAYYLGGGTREWMGKTQQYRRRLQLSPSEKKWIKKHPRIRFGIDPGFAPFEFLSKDGKFKGMAADFINLITQKTGLEFELVKFKTWPEDLEAIKQHDIDLLPCIGYSHERQSFLSYSEPYLHFSRVIVTRMDSPIRNLDDLNGLRIAIQKDSSHDQFIKEHTHLQAHSYNTFKECLLAVSRGDVDATIGNLAVTTHCVQELSLTNIKMAGYADPTTQALSFGIREDWPELTSILNHTLESITMRQRNAILAKWLPLPAAASTDIDLSQEEREWLLMHPRIRVAWDSSWAPIEFAGENGMANGIAIDYLNALEKVLGVHFETGPATDWQTAYDKLKKRQLDMSSCLAITPERLQHLLFTDTYLSLPVVLFTRDTMPYIHSIDEIEEFRVAVVKGYATDDWISHDYPDLNLTRARSVDEAFKLLNQEKVDVFAGSLLVGNYYLSKRRDLNIKIAGDTPYIYKLRMAVRSDWPLFTGILQKALASLPETDKNSFYRKWIWVKYEHGFDYSLFWKIVLGTILIILIFVYWNRRLAREISARKCAQEALMKSEKALRKSYADLKNVEELKENLTHMIVHDIRSPLMTIKASLALLREDIPKAAMGKPEEEKLLMAQASAQKATDMAQALLDISRLESGRMPLDLADIDMKELAQAAARAMDSQAHIVNIEIVLSGTSACGRADPAIIQRVLINLIANAIKASPANATVEVHTTSNDSQMVVEVRDSGCGIPEESLPYLFEKFTSFEVGKPHRKTSVGLGLAFCKMAIEAHGGHIEVESKEDQESTFRFYIPT